MVGCAPGERESCWTKSSLSRKRFDSGAMSNSSNEPSNRRVDGGVDNLTGQAVLCVLLQPVGVRCLETERGVEV